MENEKDFENELLKNGFTKKDLVKLKAVIDKGYKIGEKETLSSLISDLSGRFISCCLCILMLAFFYPIAAWNSSYKENIALFIVMLVGMAMVNFITPMILSKKAYFFMRREGDPL